VFLQDKCDYSFPITVVISSTTCSFPYSKILPLSAPSGNVSSLHSPFLLQVHGASPFLQVHLRPVTTSGTLQELDFIQFTSVSLTEEHNEKFSKYFEMTKGSPRILPEQD
jgi:hypothetical protein